MRGRQWSAGRERALGDADRSEVRRAEELARVSRLEYELQELADQSGNSRVLRSLPAWNCGRELWRREKADSRGRSESSGLRLGRGDRSRERIRLGRGVEEVWPVWRSRREGERSAGLRWAAEPRAVARCIQVPRRGFVLRIDRIHAPDDKAAVSRIR